MQRTASPSLLITILTLGVFGILSTEMGVVGIIPQIAERFGVTVPQAGLTVSVFAAVVAASAPVLPLLLSGQNRRRMMLASLGLFSAANVIAMATDSFAVLLAARALPAFLHPVYVAMAFTLAAESAEEAGADASSGIARVFLGVSAGMVLGVPMTTFVTMHVSYEAAMGVFAALSLAVMLATWRLVPDVPSRPLRIGSQLQALRRPALWLGVAAFTCINGAMFGFFSFLSDFLHEESGLSFDAVVVVLLVYGIANMAGNLLGGRVFGRSRTLFTLAVPAVMLGLYALLRTLSSEGAAAAILVSLLGVAAGAVSISGQHMISSAAREAPDFANGLFLSAANLGTAGGTALCAAFIAASGPRGALWGTFLLLAAGIALSFLRTRVQPGYGLRGEPAQGAGALPAAPAAE